MIIEVWIFITAVVFTFLGMSFRLDRKKFVGSIVENTIDKLIEDGYLRTRKDEKGEIHLLKYYED
jgi:hypothetical protein